MCQLTFRIICKHCIRSFIWGGVRLRVDDAYPQTPKAPSKPSGGRLRPGDIEVFYRYLLAHGSDRREGEDHGGERGGQTSCSSRRPSPAGEPVPDHDRRDLGNPFREPRVQRKHGERRTQTGPRKAEGVLCSPRPDYSRRQRTAAEHGGDRKMVKIAGVHRWRV